MTATLRRPTRTLRAPVPPRLAAEVALIREGLGETEFRREVKRIVRKELVRLAYRGDPPHPFRYFDDEILEMIREALEEN